LTLGPAGELERIGLVPVGEVLAGDLDLAHELILGRVRTATGERKAYFLRAARDVVDQLVLYDGGVVHL
jgi:hypothetical protein